MASTFDLLRQREVNSSAFPGHRFLRAVGGRYDLVSRLDLETRLVGHTGCVNTVCWNHTGEFLVSGGDDLKLKIWNADRLTLRSSFDSGHTANIFCARFVPDSNNQQVLSCAADHEIRLADLAAQRIRPITCHTSMVHKFNFLPESSSVFLSCSEDGTVRMFDLRTRQPCTDRCQHVMWNISRPMSLGRITIRNRVPLYSLAVNPVNSQYIALGGHHPATRLMDRRMPGRGPVKTFVPSPVSLQLYRGMPLFGGAGVTSVVFDRTGRRLLSSYSGGEGIFLFDVDRCAGLEDTETWAATIDREREKRRRSGTPSPLAPPPAPLVPPSCSDRSGGTVRARTASYAVLGSVPLAGGSRGSSSDRGAGARLLPAPSAAARQRIRLEHRQREALRRARLAGELPLTGPTAQDDARSPRTPPERAGQSASTALPDPMQSPSPPPAGSHPVGATARATAGRPSASPPSRAVAFAVVPPVMQSSVAATRAGALFARQVPPVAATVDRLLTSATGAGTVEGVDAAAAASAVGGGAALGGPSPRWPRSSPHDHRSSRTPESEERAADWEAPTARDRRLRVPRTGRDDSARGPEADARVGFVQPSPSLSPSPPPAPAPLPSDGVLPRTLPQLAGMRPDPFERHAPPSQYAIGGAALPALPEPLPPPPPSAAAAATAASPPQPALPSASAAATAASAPAEPVREPRARWLRGLGSPSAGAEPAPSPPSAIRLRGDGTASTRPSGLSVRLDVPPSPQTPLPFVLPAPSGGTAAGAASVAGAAAGAGSGNEEPAAAAAAASAAVAASSSSSPPPALHVGARRRASRSPLEGRVAAQRARLRDRARRRVSIRADTAHRSGTAAAAGIAGAAAAPGGAAAGFGSDASDGPVSHPVVGFRTVDQILDGPPPSRPDRHAGASASARPVSAENPTAAAAAGAGAVAVTDDSSSAAEASPERPARPGSAVMWREPSESAFLPDALGALAGTTGPADARDESSSDGSEMDVGNPHPVEEDLRFDERPQGRSEARRLSGVDSDNGSGSDSGSGTESNGSSEPDDASEVGDTEEDSDEEEEASGSLALDHDSDADFMRSSSALPRGAEPPALAARVGRSSSPLGTGTGTTGLRRDAAEQSSDSSGDRAPEPHQYRRQGTALSGGAGGGMGDSPRPAPGDAGAPLRRRRSRRSVGADPMDHEDDGLQPDDAMDVTGGIGNRGGAGVGSGGGGGGGGSGYVSGGGASGSGVGWSATGGEVSGYSTGGDARSEGGLSRGGRSFRSSRSGRSGRSHRSSRSGRSSGRSSARSGDDVSARIPSAYRGRTRHRSRSRGSASDAGAVTESSTFTRSSRGSRRGLSVGSTGSQDSLLLHRRRISSRSSSRAPTPRLPLDESSGQDDEKATSTGPSDGSAAAAASGAAPQGDASAADMGFTTPAPAPFRSSPFPSLSAAQPSPRPPPLPPVPAARVTGPEAEMYYHPPSAAVASPTAASRPRHLRSAGGGTRRAGGGGGAGGHGGDDDRDDSDGSGTGGDSSDGGSDASGSGFALEADSDSASDSDARTPSDVGRRDSAGELESWRWSPVGPIVTDGGLELHSALLSLPGEDDPDPTYVRNYTGHINENTVKEVNFFGPNDEYVVSGSDCGHVFLWERERAQLVHLLHGDRMTVNVVQGHPWDCRLATSGIDVDVKLWAPLATNPVPLSELASIARRRFRSRWHDSESDFDDDDEDENGAEFSEDRSGDDMADLRAERRPAHHRWPVDEEAVIARARRRGIIVDPDDEPSGVESRARVPGRDDGPSASSTDSDGSAQGEPSRGCSIW